VPDEWSRLGCAPEVEGDGDCNHDDADQLEGVPEPPAELHEVEQHGGRQGRGEPEDADRDDEVCAPPRKAERSHCP
jgi:hypothetical protein